MVRPLVRLLAVLLPLAGCASMTNTLAQDLAWERWKQCDHFNNVVLQRIELDGRIWVETRNGNADLAPWQACMQQAAAAGLEEAGGGGDAGRSGRDGGVERPAGRPRLDCGQRMGLPVGRTQREGNLYLVGRS